MRLEFDTDQVDVELPLPDGMLLFGRPKCLPRPAPTALAPLRQRWRAARGPDRRRMAPRLVWALGRAYLGLYPAMDRGGRRAIRAVEARQEQLTQEMRRVAVALLADPGATAEDHCRLAGALVVQGGLSDLRGRAIDRLLAARPDHPDAADFRVVRAQSILRTDPKRAWQLLTRPGTGRSPALFRRYLRAWLDYYDGRHADAVRGFSAVYHAAGAARRGMRAAVSRELLRPLVALHPAPRVREFLTRLVGPKPRVVAALLVRAGRYAARRGDWPRAAALLQLALARLPARERWPVWRRLLAARAAAEDRAGALEDARRALQDAHREGQRGGCAGPGWDFAADLQGLLYRLAQESALHYRTYGDGADAQRAAGFLHLHDLVPQRVRPDGEQRPVGWLAALQRRTVPGQRPATSLRRTLRRRWPALARCFHPRLRRPRSGRTDALLRLRFLIAPSGVVEHPIATELGRGVDPSIATWPDRGPNALTRCAARVLRAQRFPALPAWAPRTDVTYPVRLRPGN